MDETDEIDLADLEVQAKANALKQACTMLQRPDQLDNIEQYKKRILRKKAMTDAQLKTALQSQVEGVRDALTSLKNSVTDLNQVKTGLENVTKSHDSLDSLAPVLEKLKDESVKHRELEMTKDNLQHIYSVPERVRKCGTYIEEGKFLYAHKALMDLEDSRDELLYELHQQPQQSPTNLVTLKTYFKDVQPLNAKLERKLFDIFKRRINSVILEPNELVNVLRVIEREEQIDDHWARTSMKSGFMPDGRKKNWREKAFKTMENQCKSYIDIFLSQPDQSSEDKAWLIHQLELAKNQIMGDLKIARSILPSCCPPNYNIFNKFLSWYHCALSKSFKQLMAKGLEVAEIIPLLSWINAYKSEEMLLCPDLKIDVNDIENLLEPCEVDQLIQNYTEKTSKNLNEWMNNILKSDTEDWSADKKPDSDGLGYYFTSLPVILFEMIEEHLQLAKSISTELTACVLRLSLEQLNSFVDSYRSALQSYKCKHLADRKELPLFTIYTVAAVNNFGSIYEHLVKVTKLCTVSIDNQATALEKKLDRMMDETIEDLLDELFQDLETIFTRLITKNWVHSNEALDIICITIEDYTQDYIHLKPKSFDKLMEAALNRTISSYIRRLLSRTITFSNHDERADVAEKIGKENDQIKTLFTKIGGTSALRDRQESPLDVLPILAEVLKLKDPTMMSLEIGTLVNKYPDLNKDHLLSLFYLRSDLKGLASDLVIETLGDESAQQRKKQNNTISTVFSLVKI